MHNHIMPCAHLKRGRFVHMLHYVAKQIDMQLTQARLDSKSLVRDHHDRHSSDLGSPELRGCRHGVVEIVPVYAQQLHAAPVFFDHTLPEFCFTPLVHPLVQSAQKQPCALPILGMHSQGNRRSFEPDLRFL